MKKLFTAILLLSATQNICIGQTTVGGTISTNTTWDIAGSPYLVTSNIVIPLGISLIVKPGVIIKFSTGFGIDVNGTLSAVGTNDSLILFTSSAFSPAPGNWGPIVFNQNSTPYNLASTVGCILAHCYIKYTGFGGFTNAHGVRILGGSPFITNCIFQRNRGAIYISSIVQNLEIFNNLFIENQTNGGIFSYSIIENVSSGIDTVYLNCNSFFKNLNNGTILNFSGNAIIHNNLIAENQNGSIINMNAKVQALKNYIIDNTFNTDPVVRFRGGQLLNNTITRNGGTSSYTTIENSDSTSILNFNNIYGNYSFNPSLTYEYKNYVGRQSINSPLMNAQQNWWGTSSTHNIDSLIFDIQDDTTKCEVDYSGFLTSVDTVAPITPIRHVTKTDLGGGNIQLSWTANPEPDLAGYKLYWGNPTGYSFSNSMDVGNVTSYIVSGALITDTIAVTAYDNQADDTLDQCQCHESWYSYDYSYNAHFDSDGNEIASALCRVSVDSASTHNIVVWEKPVTTAIDSFFVYREMTANTFAKIASVPYDSLNEYHDFGANPNTTSFKYKVSTVDTTGLEGPESNYHSTIHLQNLGGGNMQWTLYQIQNDTNPVTYYRVYRDDVPSGNFQPISATIPGGNTTFTDVNSASYPNALYYVDADWNISCTVYRSPSTTRSNQIVNNIITTIPTLPSPLPSFSPNPTTGIIHFQNLLGLDNISVYDVMSRMVWSGKSQRSQIDLSNLENGIYTLRTASGNAAKVVVQR